MLMAASAAWAVDIVFDATVDVGNGSSTAGEFCIVKDGVSVCAEQGMANGMQYRFYKNNQLTFTSECAPITRIVFYCIAEGNYMYGPGGFTSNLPDYIINGNQGIWYGSGASQVVFTATSFQVRATKVVVTLGDDGSLMPPHITPSSGTYAMPMEVRMSCATVDADIYYTIDGSTPTPATAHRYTAPFSISEAMTVKAISAKDGEVSEVVTAQYEVAPSVCLGDLEVLSDNEMVYFDHEATVLYQSGSTMYIRDECDGVYGYGMVYGNTNQTYDTGDIIPPGWGGIKMTYDGRPELANLSGFKPASRNERIFPEEITIPQVGQDILWHYVVLKGVSIDTDNQVVKDQNGNTCPYYPKLTVTVGADELYDVVAIVTSFRTQYQLLIIEEQTFINIDDPVVCCFNDLYDLNSGVVAQFDCPLTVIYQNGNYTYVKDSCGEYGLIYGGNAGGPFMNGDQITGLASWTLYQGVNQLSNYGEWTKVGETDPVEPVVTPIEELSRDMAHYLIKLENVSIVDEYGTTYIEDETGRLLVYNRFGVEVPVLNPYDVDLDGQVGIADVSCIIDRILRGQNTPEWLAAGNTYDVVGFVSVYRDELEIFPIEVVYHGGSYVLIGDVNSDGELTIDDLSCLVDVVLSGN